MINLHKFLIIISLTIHIYSLFGTNVSGAMQVSIVLLILTIISRFSSKFPKRGSGVKVSIFRNNPLWINLLFFVLVIYTFFQARSLNTETVEGMSVVTILSISIILVNLGLYMLLNANNKR